MYHLEYIIISLLLLCSGSIAAAASSADMKSEQFLPVTAMTIMAALYTAYLFNALFVGFMIVVVIGCGCYIFALISLMKNRGNILKATADFLKRFFTPGMVIFILAVILIFLVTRNSKVYLWDELRLWGAYPKALYHTKQLQMGIGEGVFIYPIMQSYPPGMMLFAYFVEQFIPVFSENCIFFAYGVLGAALFMPMLEKLTWKRGWLVIPLAFVIFLIPTFFYNSWLKDLGDYYTSLFVDPILGLFLAFVVYLLLKEPFISWFSSLRFALALFTMIIIKDSGASFAIITLAAAMIMALVQKQFRKSVIRISIGILAALFSYFSWKTLMYSYGVHRSIMFDITFPAQGLINILRAFRTVDLVYSNFPALLPPITFMVLIALILVMNVLLVINTAKEKRKNFIYSSVVLYFSNVVFIFGLAVLYTNDALSGESDIPSYPRYISTILLTDFTFLAMYTVELLIDGKRQCTKSWNKFLCAAVCTAWLVMLPIRQPHSYETYDPDDVRAGVEAIASQVNSWDDSPAVKNVYMLINGNMISYSAYHHRIYFDLIDKNILIKNFYDKTNLAAIQITKQQWADELINEKYDYVYIVNVDDAFMQQYGDMFDSVIEEELYKVTIEDGMVKLVHQ